MKRVKAQQFITTELPMLGQPLYCNCNWIDNGAAKFLQNLCDEWSIKFWPPDYRRTPTDSILERLRLPRSIERGGDCEHTLPERVVSGTELVGFATKIKEICAGMCLRCIKEDEDGSESTCRVLGHL